MAQSHGIEFFGRLCHVYGVCLLGPFKLRLVRGLDTPANDSEPYTNFELAHAELALPRQHYAQVRNVNPLTRKSW